MNHVQDASQVRAVEPITYPASPKQIKFISDLLGERTLSPEHTARLAARLEANDLDNRTAKATITWLLAQPKPARAARVRRTVNPELKPGGYRLDGETYLVKTSQTTGSLYASRWDGKKWDYDSARGVIFNLTPEHHLTEEEAMAFGQSTVTCAICGRHLTNETSKKLGIGPRCRSRYNA